MTPPRPPFSGLSVLVLEDDHLLAMLLTDMLERLGCARVRHAAGVESALALLAAERPMVAVLDVNLAGEPADAVAAALDAAGVPFVFATGAGRAGIARAWAGRPVIQKPFGIGALAGALQQTLLVPADKSS